MQRQHMLRFFYREVPVLSTKLHAMSPSSTLEKVTTQESIWLYMKQ